MSGAPHLQRAPRSPVRLGRLALGRAGRSAQLAYAALALRRVEGGVRRVRPTSELAVVVHVYYREVWPEIAARLRLLGEDADVFVTLARAARDFAPSILSDVPRAHVVEVPNVGRDVLPFLTVARGLRRAGYTSVLKLHTKRSVHADDGDEFLRACLDELVPSVEGAALCRRLVSTGRAAVVGPSSRYYPLAIHVWLNQRDLAWFLGKQGSAPSPALEAPSRYGFFAGTMFWADLDEIRDCLDVPVRRFQVERGQIDGTMAHALERLFTVLPQLGGKEIWASDADGCRRLDYDEHVWPAWALRRPELE